MRTPEELLCSRKWRLAHSWWLLFGFFPFAILAWVGYLIIGIKARNWKWLLISGTLLAWIVLWFVWAGSWSAVEKYAPHPDPVSNAWWGWLGVAVWLGNAFALQWFVNRQWLVWRAHYRKKVWYRDATATQIAPAPAAGSTTAPSIIDNALASGAPVTSAPRPQPAARPELNHPSATRPAPSLPPQPSGSPTSGASTVFDLNTASRKELASLPGVNDAWADHIVATRERIGGFKDTSELVTAASMQPHFFALVREHLEIRAGRPSAPTPEAPSSGRRLEF
ncbi:helix-hairpin-helix domain-containing protein [Microbacterium caowuchunii]|uniref:helix-hairpin-helix domain-containing protein n=1 Tax=Microbacterium caowuchunii TaxID=2614638 RepID=UPI00177B8EDD|nr:helix-hairpin-helix domain-containing protein [Microbacterium caowuchunii]